MTVVWERLNEKRNTMRCCYYKCWALLIINNWVYHEWVGCLLKVHLDALHKLGILHILCCGWRIRLQILQLQSKRTLASLVLIHSVNKPPDSQVKCRQVVGKTFISFSDSFLPSVSWCHYETQGHLVAQLARAHEVSDISWIPLQC